MLYRTPTLISRVQDVQFEVFVKTTFNRNLLSTALNKDTIRIRISKIPPVLLPANHINSTQGISLFSHKKGGGRGSNGKKTGRRIYKR